MDRVVGALLAAPMLGAAGAAYLLGDQPAAPGGWRVVSRLVAVTALLAAAVAYRLLSGPVGPLRIKVSDDTLTLRQRGRAPAVFRRTDVVMLLVDEGVATRTRSLSVYGPERTLLDRWETGWATKSTGSLLRTLDRHGFPHALHDTALRPPAAAVPV